MISVSGLENTVRLERIHGLGALRDLFQALFLEEISSVLRLAQDLSIAFGQQGAPEVMAKP